MCHGCTNITYDCMFSATSANHSDNCSVTFLQENGNAAFVYLFIQQMFRNDDPNCDIRQVFGIADFVHFTIQLFCIISENFLLAFGPPDSRDCKFSTSFAVEKV